MRQPEHPQYDHTDIPPTLTSPAATAFWVAILLTGLGAGIAAGVLTLLLRREHPCWRNIKVRTNKYLNNLIEQDHRAIKRRCASMAGFKSFAIAAIKIDGIELAHRIRKGQYSLDRDRQHCGWSRKNEWALALA